MWPLALFLLMWVYVVGVTYVILYYESANGSHLETLRSRGPVFLLMVRGLVSTLLSRVLVVAAAITGLYRRFWDLPGDPVTRPPVIFVHGLYHNRTAWFFYLRWFRRWRWRHLKAITLRGKFRSVAEHAATLARVVDEVLRQTGSTNTMIHYALAAGGQQPVFLLKNSGSVVVTGDCDRLEITSHTLALYDPTQDPFDDDPFLCFPDGSGSTARRIPVEPPCEPTP